MNRRTITVHELSKPYPSIYGAPVVDKVDTSIFFETYCHDCIGNPMCSDSCCAYGEDVDFVHYERLILHAAAIESYTGIRRNGWFTEQWVLDGEVPGGKYTRTRVEDGLCVFVNRKGRGCMIHSYCLENGLDFQELKPVVGCLFPLTFDKGMLKPADEISGKFIECYGGGTILFHGAKNDLLYYFGGELVAELERIEADQ